MGAGAGAAAAAPRGPTTTPAPDGFGSRRTRADGAPGAPVAPSYRPATAEVFTCVIWVGQERRKGGISQGSSWERGAEIMKRKRMGRPKSKQHIMLYE